MSVFYVGGGKGGAGKSITSVTLMHHFISNGTEPLLFETDNGNPDVGKIYTNGKKGKACQARKRVLTDADDWKDLVLEIIKIQSEDIDKQIIINSPATTDKNLPDMAGMLNDTNIHDMRIIWAAGLQQASVTFLTKFRATVTEPTICIVQNGKDGKEKNYYLFKKDHGDLPVVYYNPLSQNFTQLLQSSFIAPHELLEEGNLSIGERGWAQQQLRIMERIGNEIIKKSVSGYVEESDDSSDFDD